MMFNVKYFKINVQKCQYYKPQKNKKKKKEKKNNQQSYNL